ncbi:MAG: YgiQ family radical SAM protein [Deltaproteobacteria bacterium]|nr:YgiQ family radical SAM protein [Deltaproteobacteria bacterium]
MAVFRRSLPVISASSSFSSSPSGGEQGYEPRPEIFGGLFSGLACSQAKDDAVATRPLPTTLDEMAGRGWDSVDVVFVTGDAYVDHPSFAMALLGRLLESAGFRVAILSQPDWTRADDWRRFGRPRLFFAISAGNMDSMINHYTANKKVRNDDAYSPGGAIGRRPDRATLAYCQRAREAFSGVPVIAGGVEASLRRIAHYDYWSDTVRRSILMDSKADFVGFGMGERVILALAQRLRDGASLDDCRDLRGLAYRLGAKSAPPADGMVRIPSYEDVARDAYAFAEMTRIAHRETNPLNARGLLQAHGDQTIVVNPPALPLTQAEMDWVYGLPYTRRPHPSYKDAAIPAFEVVKNSVQIMRGCFGGCTFCSITAHEGRIIQSRSQDSVLAEVRAIAGTSAFRGTIDDVGGPTANMYEMRCTRPEVEAKCRRLSCVHPKICKLLGTDHGPLVQLMKGARRVPKVKKVLVASGIRMDLARLDNEYMSELVTHHVGGRLKVAPEHTDPEVLDLMKKPASADFEAFSEAFHRLSEKANKQQQLVPYFIASHPGSDLSSMIDLAIFLKRNNHRPDQVQDFIPGPFDIATCMYHTGLDPLTKKPVHVAKHLSDRRLQRALLQFFKPENYFEVRKALEKAKRQDLIGDGCDALIPATPPRAAILARRARASASASASASGAAEPRAVGGRSGGGGGYRPHRKSARRKTR